MLSRAANNLYWMSRHIERAENTARVLDGALGEDTKLLDGDTLSNQMGKGTNYDSPRGKWKFDEQGPLQNVYLRKVKDTGGALANAVVFDLGVAGQPNA